MTRPSRLLRGIRLAASHFSDDDIVGVETQSHIEKIVLRDAFLFVLAFTGDGVNYLVDYFSVFAALHKV